MQLRHPRCNRSVWGLLVCPAPVALFVQCLTSSSQDPSCVFVGLHLCLLSLAINHLHTRPVQRRPAALAENNTALQAARWCCVASSCLGTCLLYSTYIQACCQDRARHPHMLACSAAMPGLLASSCFKFPPPRRPNQSLLGRANPTNQPPEPSARLFSAHNSCVTESCPTAIVRTVLCNTILKYLSTCVSTALQVVVPHWPSACLHVYFISHAA